MLAVVLLFQITATVSFETTTTGSPVYPSPFWSVVAPIASRSSNVAPRSVLRWSRMSPLTVSV